MADFLRPEARAFFRRWREVIIALAVASLGLYWALDGVGITVWLGYIFIAIGLGWAVAGFQRARFAQGGDGPGVVQVRERRLAYFGPLDGGVIDVADLTKLELDPSSHPDPSWILTGIEGQRIAIPINAKGAESLFDVFSALPGIKTEAVLDVLSHTPDVRVTVWSRTKPLLH
ncbi:hypothetical protein [Cognatiyoonia sp. IB215182]|uniref:hypothetical protein n=1 Tax=Cognatiyoonia sp. IB215182 TaxID=3097353 RepID=UPI002A0BA170|nr:hypothetical protein [Cognatiyoonia sp. IB215182]MDX8354242.1 hypothetical protein [Cognatiyoonia sp. IB215182]